MVVGFALAFWLLRDTETQHVRKRMQQIELENKELNAKLIEAQRGLQVELATNNNLAKELATVQDERLKIKEDLVFYKNMMDKKTK